MDCDIVIYDGECGICERLKQWADNRISGRLIYVPFQLLEDSNLPVAIDIEMAQKSLLYVNRRSLSVKSGSVAVFETMKSMCGFYKLIGRIFGNKYLSWIFEPGYRIIAQNRHRISSMLGMKECKIIQ